MIHTKYDSIFGHLLKSHSMSETNLSLLLDAILAGDISAQNIFEAYLLVKKKEGIRDAEIAVLVRLFLDRARRIRVQQRFLDVCGTGGDKSNSFNISTVSAFVLAAGGVPILKHGNRAVSSKCGSSDLLEALGFSLEKAADKAIATLKKYNFGYLHAPLFHPLFAKIASIRRRIGEPTVLNFLGPLLHPASPKLQLAGIGNQDIFRHYADWLVRSGRERVIVLRSRDGLDEAVPYGTTDLIEIQKGRKKMGSIHAKDLGFRSRSKKDLEVDSKSDNVTIVKRLLAGKLTGPKKEAVLLNAGLGFYISGNAKNLREGIRLADKVIQSGAGTRLLSDLRKALKR